MVSAWSSCSDSSYGDAFELATLAARRADFLTPGEAVRGGEADCENRRLRVMRSFSILVCERVRMVEVRVGV
jgi:hypothetical protein